MKVHIDKNESTEGLVFKKKIYEMWVRCEMTTQEIEAYKKIEKEIRNHIIAEYADNGLELNFTVGSLVYTNNKGKGFRFKFQNQHEIPSMEKEVMEGVKAFSDYLKKIQQGGSLGSNTVEL